MALTEHMEPGSARSFRVVISAGSSWEDENSRDTWTEENKLERE